MCGRFQFVKNAKSKEMARELEVDSQALRYSPDIAPGAAISIIHTKDGQRNVSTAVWWLFLDQQTLKPNYKYSSFNSRSDKLNQSKSFGYRLFRQSRCLIPASAFVEGLGDKKTYHRIELLDQAISFGGLYKEYINQHTGEFVYSASIITLPPIEKWSNIHPKSLPLMLDFKNKNLIEKWLDPDFTDVAAFNDLLKPEIHQTQCVTLIDKPSKWQPIGESFLIS